MEHTAAAPLKYGRVMKYNIYVEIRFTAPAWLGEQKRIVRSFDWVRSRDTNRSRKSLIPRSDADPVRRAVRALILAAARPDGEGRDCEARQARPAVGTGTASRTLARLPVEAAERKERPSPAPVGELMMLVENPQQPEPLPGIARKPGPRKPVLPREIGDSADSVWTTREQSLADDGMWEYPALSAPPLSGGRRRLRRRDRRRRGRGSSAGGCPRWPPGSLRMPGRGASRPAR
jgi:hypothetical protein